jgi:hypothetical protein
MSRRFRRDDQPFNPDNVATPGAMRLYFRLIVIAAAIGLMCGLIWTLWHLLP